MALDFEALNEFAKVDTEPDSTIIERLRFDSELEIPHQLTDLDMWLNYCNDDLYHMDKAIRGYINKSRWTRLTKGQMKTAVPLVFLNLFGRKPDAHDSQVCSMMHRILLYYCTKHTGTSKIAGQRFKKVYYFSKYAMRSKRPMSLRLRLEESDGSVNSYRAYGTGRDKAAVPRPGVTAHGPLANGAGGVPE